MACSGLSATARADSDLPGPIPAALVRVIDGDTIEVRARIWLDLDLTTRVHRRARAERGLSRGAPAR
jgi:Iap family predicted aminopeptidase